MLSDDAQWDFLCNNSPRLVEKRRSKTPHLTFAFEEETKVQLPTSKLKQNYFKKSSNLRKNSHRITLTNQPLPPSAIISSKPKRSSFKLLKPSNPSTPLNLRRSPLNLERKCLFSKKSTKSSIKPKSIVLNK